MLCASSYSAYSQINLPTFEYTPTTPPSSRSSYSLEPYNNPLLNSRIELPEFNYSRTNTILESDWYQATVTYYNPRTETKSKYNLGVRVHNDRIVAISFGDGGSIHTGANNSGYTYSGGDLIFRENMNGDIVSADTTAKIYTNAGYTYLKVEL